MSLTPKKAGFKPKKTDIIIVCEDSKSNYYYICDKTKSCMPNPSQVFVLFGNSEDVRKTQPDKIVNYTTDLVSAQNKFYCNYTDEKETHFYKEAYCVVDVDDNLASGKLQQAYTSIATAQTATPEINYRLIVSNECFEIWYILHFQDITEPLFRGTIPQVNSGITTNTNIIGTILENCVDWANIPIAKKPANRKVKSYEYFFEDLQRIGNEADAIQRAKALDANGTPNGNPSTDMYILIERLNRFKQF